MPLFESAGNLPSRLAALAVSIVAYFSISSAPANAQQAFRPVQAGVAPYGAASAIPSGYMYFYNGKPFCVKGGTGINYTPLQLTLPASSKSYNYAVVTVNIGMLFTPLTTASPCAADPSAGALDVSIGLQEHSPKEAIFAVGGAGTAQLPYEGSFALTGFVALNDSGPTDIRVVWASKVGTVYAAFDETTASLSATLINCSSKAGNCMQASPSLASGLKL